MDGVHICVDTGIDVYMERWMDLWADGYICNICKYG